MSKHNFSITIITSFPEMFPGTLQYSLAGQALKNKLWQYRLIDIRKFGLTKHKNIDDSPYGGGAGMVMRPDVVSAALDFALAELIDITEQPLIIYMSPRGEPLTHQLSYNLTKYSQLIILCGRFEGIDERLLVEYNIKEISIGDYILSGGELAAMVLLDSCIRLLPNVIGNPATLQQESFSLLSTDNILLEYPLYTRPVNWRGHIVPPVLLSGDHQKINEWRCAEALKITQQRRPDLLK